MGLLDMLGQAAAEVIAEQRMSNELSKKSDKKLIDEAYDLQAYFLTCDSEDKGSEEYVYNSKQLKIIEDILKTRGYYPAKVYLPKDMDELEEIGEFFHSALGELYE